MPDGGYLLTELVQCYSLAKRTTSGGSWYLEVACKGAASKAQSFLVPTHGGEALRELPRLYLVKLMRNHFPLYSQNLLGTEKVTLFFSPAPTHAHSVATSLSHLEP